MLSPTVVLVFGDLLMGFTAFSVGALFLLREWDTYFNLLQKDAPVSVVFTLALVVSSFFFGLYRREQLELKRTIATLNVSSAFLAFFLFSGALTLFDSLRMSSGHILLSLSIFILLQFCWHARCSNVFSLTGLNKRVAIIGAGPMAMDVRNVLSNDRLADNFIGYIWLGGEDIVIDESEMLGEADNLLDVIRQSNIQKIVIAMSERRGILPVRQILSCKLGGIQIVDSVDYIEEVTGRLALESVNPSWFIFSSGSRITPMIRFVRRLLDIIFASLGLCVALPFFPIIAAFIKCDSRGPVFFKQRRVGEGEREFTLFKFRSMDVNAELGTGAVWAQKDDPRITRLGRFLRKSRIDELPQLINVLKGDMSFVGPRPERPEFVSVLKEKIPYYSNRHVIKPGVTGWAQVKYPYGASVDDAMAKLRYDLFYIKNYTPLLDIVIIVETIKVVLFRSGGR